MVAMTEVADHLDVVEYAGRSLMQVDEEAGVALSLVGFEVFCREWSTHLKFDFCMWYLMNFTELYETVTETTSIHYQYLVGRSEHIHDHSFHRGCARTCDENCAGIV